MVSLVKRLLKIRIIRYGMVGGIGILVNNGALFCFKLILGLVIRQQDFVLYLVSSACAFEVSNIVNFVLNQLFTYREQVKHIHGREWVRRAFKGQLTSLSALLISYMIGAALVFFLHANDYLANTTGIVLAFVYNFFISNKLVFRATGQQQTERVDPTHLAIEDRETMPLPAMPNVKLTPKQELYPTGQRDMSL